MALLLAIPAFAAPETKSQINAPAMTPEQEKMMKAMEEAGKVSENHKALDYLVGDWTTHTKSWQAPGAKAEESTGKAMFEPMYDGRFIRETYEGSFMGKPFQGTGFLGYDNMKKKYTTVWIDNFSTASYVFEGDSKDKGKTITSTASFMCPATGTQKSIKSVMKKVSKNEFHYEHFDTDDKGREFKSMEIVYQK